MLRKIAVLAALVLLAWPAPAAAQFTTEAVSCPSPTTCDECYYGLTGKHRATMTMGSWVVGTRIAWMDSPASGIRDAIL